MGINEIQQHDNASSKADKKNKQKDVNDEILDASVKHSKKRGKKPHEHWGSIGEVLNEMFRQGDKIEVFNGADQVDKVGSFIAATDDYLIWANSHGDVSLQNIGGAFSVRKTDSKKKSSKNKHRDKKKKNDTIHNNKLEDNKAIKNEFDYKSEKDLVLINNLDIDNKDNLIEDILSDVKELKVDVESTLVSNLDIDNPESPLVTKTL